MGLFRSEKSSENEHGCEVVENIDVDELDRTAKNAIYRCVDTEAGVVLYYVPGPDEGGLTAVPLSETELGSGEKTTPDQAETGLESSGTDERLHNP